MVDNTLDNITAPVIAGLAVGVGLVVVFAFLPFDSSNPPASLNINNTENLEFKTKYNFPKIPDLHMIVNSTGRVYAAEEGSYCWDRVCRDTIPIVPENTIVLDRGNEIEFKIINYKQPDVFEAHLTSEDPSLQVRCITDNVTGGISCAPPEGVDLPDLTKLDSDFKYKVDVPSGFYMIGAGANWLTEDGNPESDSSYYYRVQVK